LNKDGHISTNFIKRTKHGCSRKSVQW